MIECVICDKTYHKSCIEDVNFDEKNTNLCTVCKFYTKFNNDIVNAVGIDVS